MRPAAPATSSVLARDAAWSLAIALASTAVVVHGGGIWSTVTSGDFHATYLPKFEHAAHRLFTEGRLALWNPYEFCGIPILGTAHGQVLYPPVLVLFALLSLWPAAQALFGFHALVLSLGMMAYLRRHGIGRPQAAVAAIIALIGVLRTPDAVGVDHPNFLAAVAWIPALLLFAERAGDGGGVGSVAGIALLTAAQWFTGYPEFALTTALLLTLVVGITGSAPWYARLTAVASGVALGAALAAVQILPLLESLAESTRAAHQWQFALWRARSAVHGAGELLTRASAGQGPAVLLLAAVAVARRRPSAHRIAWAVALGWCVLSRNWPFDLLFTLPGLRNVRFGYAWPSIAGVFLGVLAADGLGRLERTRTPTRWLGRALAVAVLVGAVRVLSAVPTLDFPEKGLRFPAPDYEVLAQRAPTLRRWLHASPGSRVMAERELVSGSGLRHGLRLPAGHEPAAPPRRVMHLLEEAGLLNPMGRFVRERWIGAAARPEILRLLAVRYLVVPARAQQPFVAGGFTPRDTLPPDDVLLEGDALPRARLVHRVVVADAPTDEGTLAALFEHIGDLATVAVVDRRPVGTPLPEAGSTTDDDRIAIVEDSSDRVALVAQTTGPAMLVLADAYYPGWSATVDGVATEILRADHAFRGVLLAPGRHRVVFEYAPSSVRLGGLVSAAAALALLAALVVRRIR